MNVKNLFKHLPKDYSDVIYDEIKNIESNYEYAKEKEKTSINDDISNSDLELVYQKYMQVKKSYRYKEGTRIEEKLKIKIRKTYELLEDLLKENNDYD